MKFLKPKPCLEPGARIKSSLAKSFLVSAREGRLKKSPQSDAHVP